jgi:hypothetical protein
MPASTTVTLANDVIPIFNAAGCTAAAACHAKGTTTPPVLGDVPPGMTTTPADVSANIVGVAAGEVPSMQLVAPGDPEHSYLMRKVESDNPGCGLMCTSSVAGGCATRMPSALPPLSAMQQGVIRDWIKAGAH